MAIWFFEKGKSAKLSDLTHPLSPVGSGFHESSAEAFGGGLEDEDVHALCQVAQVELAGVVGWLDARRFGVQQGAGGVVELQLASCPFDSGSVDE